METRLASFHLISTCRPVKARFQVEIEINEDLLGQSGDRIRWSHITIHDIMYIVDLPY